MCTEFYNTHKINLPCTSKSMNHHHLLLPFFFFSNQSPSPQQQRQQQKLSSLAFQRDDDYDSQKKLQIILILFFILLNIYYFKQALSADYMVLHGARGRGQVNSFHRSLGNPETVFPPNLTELPLSEPETDSLKLFTFSRKCFAAS